uniref:Transmembrane domain containing protein n=1 Tax=Marseillevirus sp. TaxID=2809551 RepID=A0AA96EMK1_9VIRU|nr:transmembrane domain containing protein [Marseillevirus sp.]
MGVLAMLCSFEFLKFAFVLGVAVFCYFKYQKTTKGKKGGFQFLFPRQKKKRRIVKQKDGKHELRCRQILEEIYGQQFPSVRPDFLKNPKTGRNLELDCYNSNLKLALEYDGIQHAKYNKFFHKKGPQQFVDQARRDFFKDKTVKRMGIDLVRVPHYIRYDDLDRFIRTRLKELKRL